ncbi:MAG: hypothetical protein P8Y47_02390, partial [Alphaproteobacteria bacterium]
MSYKILLSRFVILATFVFLSAMFSKAWAQESILNRGDAVVTGFSGIKPSEAPLLKGANPLDEFFIDLDGPSAQILSLAAPGGAPEGQLISAPPIRQFKARDIGQVFATTLDDGLGEDVPNIYLGQTAAYGLYIVTPDADGDGVPERAKKGSYEAQWMAGQLGEATGGGTGAIYKVDGQTGAVSLFATLPDNSGAGVGDIVFDKESRQFFASDLDKGLIYRLSKTGEVIDSFDHGVMGRPAKGLGAVVDDGSQIDITSIGFDTETPDTWGFTQKERRVYGLAMQGGRLYYAVDGQVWSIGVSADGFAEEARWELDAEALKSDGPITDMLFDKAGRMYLAQRGGQRASYDYSVFAEPEKSSVVRYHLEDPDDPNTESVWAPDAGEYAIGLTEDYRHAEGGISLGFAHDETGALRYGTCGKMLWSTGHRLRTSDFAEKGVDDNKADVHGLQGNLASLVLPKNAPPQQSYFADYDGFFGDSAKSGHMGDVEIWQPCEGGAPQYGSIPPGYLPPLATPPEDFPPEWIPPGYEFNANLKLKKWAQPKKCSPWFGGWLCQYRIRVQNTGPDFYSGPVMIEDWLPANPASSTVGFSPTPPWTCWKVGSSHKCFRPGVFLAPGASIDLKAYAFVPKSYKKCHLRNAAAIKWAPGGTQWNTNPFDDIDDANALIPAEHCKPGKKTDLKIYKRRLMACYKAGNHLRCAYRVMVENMGPGPYNGDIVVKDIIPAGTTATFSSAPGTWDNCPKVGGTHTCTHQNASLPNPGDTTSFTVRVDFSFEKGKQLQCRVPNKVKITKAPGGSPKNTDPTNDTASAVAPIPEELCHGTPEKTDLKIYKRSYSCYKVEDHLRCSYKVIVRNMGPGPYNGDIKVKDIIPAGTTAIFSSSPGTWNNCPKVAGVHTCTYTNASLPNVNDSTHFFVRVDFNRKQAKEMKCRVRNRVKITKAPGGSPLNTNLANDTASAIGVVPQKLCRGPGRTNLKIEKVANPVFCNKTSGGWWCHYAIRVINTGSNDYHGKLEIDEALPAEPLNANWGNPWNCSGVGGGGGGGAVCKHPVTLIKPNHVKHLFLNVKFSDEVVKAKACALVNVAKIAKPVPGSNKNSNPNDDTAGVAAKVDPAFCKKGPTNLLLKKYGAQPQCNVMDGKYRCPYNVIVRNLGDNVYKGEVIVKDILPQAASGSTVHVLAPWTCSGAVPTLTCKHPYVELDPAQQVALSIRFFIDPRKYKKCSLKNTARILKAAGGTLQNQNATDDEDSATLDFPPAVIGGIAYCHTPEPNKPCPPGYDWKGGECERIGVTTPLPPVPHCPAGYVGKYPDCRKRVSPHCPKGTVGKYPDCRKRVSPHCPKGTVGKYPNCRKRVSPHCPKGTVGKYPNCRKRVSPHCPKGTVGRYPKCRKVILRTPHRVAPRKHRVRP